MGDDVYMGQELCLRLEKIDIDMNIGIKYCGDEDFYREILGIAYESYLERFPKLDKYFEESDYNNYTILVHSIKSGSANIGAMKLSNMAKALEDAGKNEEYEYIIHNHQSFVDYYHMLMKGLANILQLEKVDSQAGKDVQCYDYIDMTSETKNVILEKVYYYLEELDLDMAEELVDEMLRCNLKPNEMELLASVKALLGSFGVEGAKERIRKLLDKN